MPRTERSSKTGPKLDVSYGSVHSENVSPTGVRYGTRMTRIFGESGYLQSILDAESAASTAISELYPGKVPPSAARSIRKAASVRRVKPDEVHRIEARETHHETAAIIKELSKQAGKSGAYVHYSLTSADVIETAKAVQMRKGLAILLETTESLRDSCLAVSVEWKAIAAIARTHGQHAIPVSFGMPFAFFGFCLNKSVERLRYDLENCTEGKLSGAVGSYDVSSDEGMDGFEIERRALGKLGIRPSAVSMQTPPRENISYILTDIAVLGGRIASIAEYIKTLRRTEILELIEPVDRKSVSSSAMPHKNVHGNPFIEERCISISRTLRGFASTSLESMLSEDFRDLTASLSDRISISEAFVLADYSARLLENVIRRVKPEKDRIRSNLGSTYGAVTAQRIMSRLISKGMHRSAARLLSQQLALEALKSRTAYADLLLKNVDISGFLSHSEISELSDPRTYLGKSSEIIERTFSLYAGRGRGKRTILHRRG